MSHRGARPYFPTKTKRAKNHTSSPPKNHRSPPHMISAKISKELKIISGGFLPWLAAKQFLLWGLSDEKIEGPKNHTRRGSYDFFWVVRGGSHDFFWVGKGMGSTPPRRPWDPWKFCAKLFPGTVGSVSVFFISGRLAWLPPETKIF